MGGQKVAKFVLRWTDRRAQVPHSRRLRLHLRRRRAVIKISPMQGRKARLTMAAVKRPFPAPTRFHSNP